MTKIRYSDIKRSYPKPTRAKVINGKSDYCVGGALCLFLRKAHLNYISESSFPSAISISDAIKIANPKISNQNADLYAEQIIEYNDKSRYKEAWNYLKKALAAR